MFLLSNGEFFGAGIAVIKVKHEPISFVAFQTTVVTESDAELVV